MASLVAWLVFLPAIFGVMAVFAFLFGGYIISTFARLVSNIFDWLR